jgi:hypothetical protein
VSAAAKALQVAQRVVADHDHRASTPAVAAVGAAPRHVRFAAKARGPIASRPRLDMDSRAIVKHSALIVTNV